MAIKRWLTTVGAIGLLLLALAVPGGTRAQGSVSPGCTFIKDQIHVISTNNGEINGPFAAGDHLTFAAGPPVEGDEPTTIALYRRLSNTDDRILLDQAAFPGTLTYTVPTDDIYIFTYQVVDSNAFVTLTISCESEPPPPTTPTCFGQDATISVKDGTIVGGPDTGKTYKGKLKGTKGNDVIVGTDGKDTLEGSDGNDVLCGLGGDDTLNGNNGDDRLDGGSGKDTVDAGAGNDQLIGGDGDDTLQGNNGNDTLDGGAGKDRLEGGNDNDTLTGGADADRFKGGPGIDTATDYNASEGDTKNSIP